MAQTSANQSDRIAPSVADNLSGLYFERVARSPDAVAYRQYDAARQEWTDTSWADMACEVGRVQAAMRRQGLVQGDRIALMLRNAREWVLFDQAALGLGIVTVPLYTDDRPENVARILRETDARLLVVDGRRQWRRLQEVAGGFPGLVRIVSLGRIETEDRPRDPHLDSFSDWSFGAHGAPVRFEGDGDSLASIVYTSGTAGQSKGVMLSHRNMLENAWACSKVAVITPVDLFLSFLPLSHTLERTAGYYLPMLCGSTVAFARSVQQLGEDLQAVRPTLMISVPRVYERVFDRLQHVLARKGGLAQTVFTQAVSVGWRRYLHRQGRGSWHPGELLWPLLDRQVGRGLRERLGGRLRFAICGGAPLNAELARTFTALGIPVLQGYGLTEAGPVVSVNRPEDNHHDSIGPPLDGLDVRIGPQDELLVHGPGVMQGYWQLEAETRAVLDKSGWLHTGDQARIDSEGHLHIIGRIKDIIVLANGEKVPPAAMEAAIALDPLFDQVLVLGEGRPWLVGLIVLNPEQWSAFARDNELDPDDPSALTDRYVERQMLRRIGKALAAFPGYAQLRRVGLLTQPWTVEDGLLTPTQKLKRALIEREQADRIETLYASL